MEFKTKNQAIKFMIANGYTEHHQTSSAGDGPWGSREYYMKPGCERNQYGAPMETACASKICGIWVVNF